MPITHFLLPLLVVIVFFFIKPPIGVPFRLVVWYGMVNFAMQFSFMFLGIYAGMPPGMASIVMQVQIFFSLFFAMIFLGERPTSWGTAGALVSCTGIMLIALSEKINSFWAFIFILAAAASWGLGTLITKKITNNTSYNMFSLVIWGSLVAVIPMFILSLIVEGQPRILYMYHHVTWVAMSALLYTVYASTLVGYGVWNWLLSRYPVGFIVPFTLLVPIVGVLSSILVLGEPFEVWKLMAGLLVKI